MVVRELGGPEALETEVLEDPLFPSIGQVVIAVEAIGCNFFDTLITKGMYQVRPELPFAPGGEVAGRVEAIGKGVEALSVGDRVTALLPYGGFASHIVAPQERVFPMPDGLGFQEAAAMGIVYQTSQLALERRAALTPGETLLVHAAAGGVGLAAVQLGVAMGAHVIGTAGTTDKLKLIEEHGAAHAINYREEDWVARVKDLTDQRGADVIYDSVGGKTFELSSKCVAFEGRILIIGFASGQIPNAAMNRVMVKNYSLVGLHWGLYFERNPQALHDSQAAIDRFYEQGKLRPLVSATYPLKEAAKALDALAARKTTGKIILIP